MNTRSPSLGLQAKLKHFYLKYWPVYVLLLLIMLAVFIRVTRDGIHIINISGQELQFCLYKDPEFYKKFGHLTPPSIRFVVPPGRRTFLPVNWARERAEFTLPAGYRGNVTNSACFVLYMTKDDGTLDKIVFDGCLNSESLLGDQLKIHANAQGSVGRRDVRMLERIRYLLPSFWGCCRRSVPSLPAGRVGPCFA